MYSGENLGDVEKNCKYVLSLAFKLGVVSFLNWEDIKGNYNKFNSILIIFK